MEVSDVRRRLRGAIEDARRRVAERRARVDEASRSYERFLPDVAVPAFHKMVQALGGEGHRFKVQTPAHAVRLAPDRATDDHIELALDSDRDAPVLVARTTRGRGRRMISTERVVVEHKSIAETTEEDVIAVLLEELIPFIE
jgi:hypothetical protein